MSVETTRQVLEAYFATGHEDTSMMADDIVFTDMASGREDKGPESIVAMLNWFYHVAFEATTETSQMIFADGHAVWEGFVVGKHIGEFAGIPATNKEVRVPICVSYDVDGDKLKRGRIYFSVASFLAQIEG